MKKFRKKIFRPNLRINFIFFRILLTFLVAAALFFDNNNIALLLFSLVAAASVLAKVLKRRPLQTPMTNLLGHVADKFIINVTAAMLWYKGLLPLWFLLVLVVKDGVAIIVGFVIIIRHLNTVFPLNRLDKLTFLSQIVALAVVMLGNTDFILIYAAAALTIVSGAYSIVKSEIKFLKKPAEFDEFRLRNLVKLPDYFTLMNVVSGLLCIFFAIGKYYRTAAAMLLIAVIMDTVDGRIAKMIKRQGDFGKQLDSLADSISFGVAPVVFGFSLIQTKFAMMAFMVFLFAGVLRLARYNVSSYSPGFQGMPITMNGLVIPLIYFFGLRVEYYPYVFLLLGMLMVSSVKVRRIF